MIGRVPRGDRQQAAVAGGPPGKQTVGLPADVPLRIGEHPAQGRLRALARKLHGVARVVALDHPQQFQ